MNSLIFFSKNIQYNCQNNSIFLQKTPFSFRHELSKLVPKVILPKKGKISKSEQDKIRADKEYVILRRKHSAVESNINALEHRGLDRCPDRGIDNFRKYVSMSIVAHNIHLIGSLVQRKLQKQNRYTEANIRLAA